MKNCENCAREVCRFMPPSGEVSCGYWRSDRPSDSNWISCSERMPEIDRDVIIYYPYWKDNPIQVAHLQYDGMYFELSDGEFNLPVKAVTHWMPLPNPPESE